MLGTSYNHQVGWWDAGHFGCGDIYEGVTLDVSFLFFSSLLYFLGSQPCTNGIGMGFNHLMRYIKWRWRVPLCWI